MEPPCNLEKLILADGASEIRMPAISHKKIYYFTWISYFAASALFSLSNSGFLHMCASILEI